MHAEPQIEPEGTPATPYHIHPPETPLHVFEAEQRHKLYLEGRTLAYGYMLNQIENTRKKVLDVRARSAHDDHLWSLTEGELSALTEIRELLENSLERNALSGN
jgi:hypothetical protein